MAAQGVFLFSSPYCAPAVCPAVLHDRPGTVPTAPPQNVQTDAVNSTTIQFLWNPPPQQFINGINQGYKVPGPSSEPWVAVVLCYGLVGCPPLISSRTHGTKLQCMSTLVGAGGWSAFIQGLITSTGSGTQIVSFQEDVSDATE